MIVLRSGETAAEMLVPSDTTTVRLTVLAPKPSRQATDVIVVN
jgi:hypothetical protein